MPPTAASSRQERWGLLAALAAWLAFAVACATGAPPAVDLAAHAAELEVLKGLLRGDPALGAIYDWHLTLGYGLPTWLFLPLAFLFDGAFAARAGWAVTLAMFPISVATLLHAMRRPLWPAVLALPFAFNVSYWYGLLPGLFAQPMAVFAAAAAVWALAGKSPARWAVVNLLAASVLLSNLFTFVALCVVMAGLMLQARGLKGAVLPLLGSLLGPGLLGLPMLLPLLSRSAHEGPWPQTTYDAAAHFNWFFKTLGPEGVLSLAVPLVTAAAFIGYGLWKRDWKSPGLAMTLAVLALYLATPKTLGGIFLVCTRLPSLAGLFALTAVDGAQIPRPLRLLLVTFACAALGQIAVFHVRFGELTLGLEEITREAPPLRHGYLSLEGERALGSKHIYLAHLGQWWTARHGGLGHDFFADSDHHIVRFRPGVALPAELAPDHPADFAHFDALLVFGLGDLPAGLEAFDEVQRVGPWRKLLRRGGQRATVRSE